MLVGLIANPEAGHDVRRIVSHASTFSNQEKVHIIRRVLVGVAAAGVRRVAYLPEPVGLVRFAVDGLAGGPEVVPLDMPIRGRATDSTDAAERLVTMGAGCIITLGGDGTNRTVAKASGSVPLVAISTGTNNVFPFLIEGTVAGLAAGAIASSRLDLGTVVRQAKRLEVSVDGTPRDIALVDVAVSREPYTGARAIWDPALLDELLLTRAEPDAIGLSAIGGQLLPIRPDDRDGLLVRVGEGSTVVRAALAPGLIVPIPIAEVRRLRYGDGIAIEGRRGTIALDGEREIEFYPYQSVAIQLTKHGPHVADIAAALRAAAEAGLFRSTPPTPSGWPDSNG